MCIRDSGIHVQFGTDDISVVADVGRRASESVIATVLELQCSICIETVSYTHLDVYKRQAKENEGGRVKRAMSLRPL